MFGLETGLVVLLIFSILCACIFEFVNGFHDTANAVATVIYTNSLKPMVAVPLSAILNCLGLFFGIWIMGEGIPGVAMGIVNLLPVEALIDQNIHHSMAMVMALLFSAILWNLGTWWFGLPASSSHTLIGSILGVGIAFGMMYPNSAGGVNWEKAEEVGQSLLFSPLFGCTVAIILMFILKKVAKKQQKVLFSEPDKKKAPPLWIRCILILTSCLVSFFHGNNDGQKGVGLVMLILIGIVPAHFALNRNIELNKMQPHIVKVGEYANKINISKLSDKDSAKAIKTKTYLADLLLTVSTTNNLSDLGDKKPFEVRKEILVVSKNMKGFIENGGLEITESQKKELETEIKGLKKHTDYSPDWVIVMIAFSLGLGTMIGWKRIVITIGEKIGKNHLTYAQGASAELVAASTIGLATWFNLPVSTTHVLSSGIAGTMIAEKGLKNLQGGTVRNILLAWLLTLPVTILLSGGLYWLFLQVM